MNDRLVNVQLASGEMPGMIEKNILRQTMRKTVVTQAPATHQKKPQKEKKKKEKESKGELAMNSAKCIPHSRVIDRQPNGMLEKKKKKKSAPL